MIINFSVKNFGSIKDTVTLSFEPENSNYLEQYYIINPIENLRLLKLGLIYGPNGSGKTTILKALDFLRDIVLEPFEKKTDTFDYKPFLFDEISINAPTTFSLEFIQNKIKYRYEVILNRERIIEEKLFNFDKKKAIVFERKTDEEKQLTIITLGSKVKKNVIKKHESILEGNTLWNRTIFGGFLKSNIDFNELKEVIDWFKETLYSLILPRTNLLGFISSKIDGNEINKKNIIGILNKADFKITDIIVHEEEQEISSELIEMFSKTLHIPDNALNEMKESGKFKRKEVFFEHTITNNEIESKFELPYEDESQGTQRYYQFSGLLEIMLHKGGIFSVDELESSLHPDLFQHFLDLYLKNSRNSQLIATTHLREHLMKTDSLRHDAIWFTDKKVDGSTELFSAADFDSSVIRNTSSIYNAYKIGKLGAIPELGDTYIEVQNG